MPFQRSNVGGIPLLKSPWDMDFADMLQKGIALRHEPQRLMREKEKELLANSLKQNELNYAPQTSEADIRLKQGHATQYENMAKLPYGGNVTGDVMQSIMVHNILNDPNAPAELKQLVGGDRKALIRQRLMGNTPESAKLREDEQRIMNDPNLSDQEKEDAIGYNRSKNIKNSVIPELEVQKTRADITSEGFEKLLQPDMLEALTQYSGGPGTAKRAADEWEKWLTGKTPERLLKYEDAESTAEGVAMNLRAAIKESVSPAKGEKILDMISPANIKRSPEQAIRRLQAAADFFETERKGIYQGTGRTLKPKTQNNKKTNYEGKTRNLDLTTRKLS